MTWWSWGLVALVAILLVDNLVGYVLSRSWRKYALLLKEQNEQFREQRAILHEAVNTSRKVFNRYADMHAAKETPEGNDKCARNRMMAQTMNVALELTGGEDLLP